MKTLYWNKRPVAGASCSLRWRALAGPLAALAFTMSGASFAAGLNDTGITDCSNDTVVVNLNIAADNGTHPRQDCRYGRDPAAAAGSLTKTGAGGKGFDFSKIANNGTLADTAALGPGATDWACTRDNVSGLIWELKTSSGLRDQSHSYSWYSSDVTSNGGAVGTPSGGNCATIGRCDTEKFVEDVNANPGGLCGATDWRMPTSKELDSIVDYGRSNPAIDPTFFPNTAATNFWSASPSATGDIMTPAKDLAWSVGFSEGGQGAAPKNLAYQARLVRVGP